MKEFALRSGDLLVSPVGAAIVTKLTKKYCYYYFSGRFCRIKKIRLWAAIDKAPFRIDIQYESTFRRRKQRTLRTLDLHTIRHDKAEDTVRSFFNFVDLPCEVITGNSVYMNTLVRNLVEEYEWQCHTKDDFNGGALIIHE